CPPTKAAAQGGWGAGASQAAVQLRAKWRELHRAALPVYAAATLAMTPCTQAAHASSATVGQTPMLPPPIPVAA
ncbi:hypothetical protein HaLaN_32632, partial [Haematococcus lacustris]